MLFVARSIVQNKGAGSYLLEQVSLLISIKTWKKKKTRLAVRNDLDGIWTEYPVT